MTTDREKLERYKYLVDKVSSPHQRYESWRQLVDRINDKAFPVEIVSVNAARVMNATRQEIYHHECSEQDWGGLCALLERIAKTNMENAFQEFISSVKQSVKDIESEVLS